MEETSSHVKPPLSIFWPEMDPGERMNHFFEVGDRLLEHRYRYYVKDDPVLSDAEYDYLERYYRHVAEDLGMEAVAAEMVDFDHKREDCQAAAARVESNTDHHSLWEASMKPIWDRIGKSKQQLKAEQEKDAS